LARLQNISVPFATAVLPIPMHCSTSSLVCYVSTSLQFLFLFWIAQHLKNVWLFDFCIMKVYAPAGIHGRMHVCNGIVAVMGKMQTNLKITEHIWLTVFQTASTAENGGQYWMFGCHSKEQATLSGLPRTCSGPGKIFLGRWARVGQQRIFTRNQKDWQIMLLLRKVNHSNIVRPWAPFWVSPDNLYCLTPSPPQHWALFLKLLWNLVSC